MTLLTMLAAAAATNPAMTIETVPGKGYAIAIAPFAASDMDAVQGEMQTLATAKCGRLTLRWGKFKYDNVTFEGINYARNYRMAFACIDPATDPYRLAPSGWKPSEQDNADASAFLNRYLAAFDRVDAAAGVAMMEPIAEVTAVEWVVQPRALAAARGEGTRLIRGPYWENNPDGAAHPGAYAYFAFTGVYSGLASACGYLMLYRAGAGHYLVSQQNISAISKTDIAAHKFTTADAEAQCADYR